MRKNLKGSALLVSLMLIAGILATIFVAKENFIYQESMSLNDYNEYLNQQLSLKNKIKPKCEEYKKEIVTEIIDKLHYTYYCDKKSLFVKPKPTKEKYISIDNIENWLDITTYRNEITYISSLSELPESSEINPKIVMTKNKIDEKLEKNFYGIIITDYYFDIKGDKKIYGVIYSSFDNEREERNLTFRRKVIDNLDNKFSVWQEKPHSRNLLNND